MDESAHTYLTGMVGVFTACNWEEIGSRYLLIFSVLLVSLRLYREVRKFIKDRKEDGNE